MLRNIGLTIILCIPFTTFANDDKPPKGQIYKAQGLSLGIGAVGSSGIYVGEKTEITPIPVISYETEHFFIRGLYAGVELYKNNLLTVNAITNINMMNLDIDNLSKEKLAANNISTSQLEDRERSVDLGIESILRLPYGLFSLQAVNDIGGASDGAELRFNYQYFWRINPKVTLMPNVGIDWLSDKRANYYYGILDSEVSRGVVAYKPNHVFIPHLSLGASYALTDKVKLSGAAMQKFLPNKVQDGPLVDKSKLTNFYMALTYKF
ncbi:MipA/OmpV family protein [Acinetobacter portensis]|uniref:MipA/OmpV family protein n=3 Tax=Acinetobacter TaxID=469 RepID=A0A6L6GBL5_9GAMM|nr:MULTISPECIES: MipA/OmpV family protein [Acinetobacter]MCK7607914.1 MipA/OmpV family protein [Acinetobacter portensis]MCK7638572.1 MipA/OmpV family protein [Acinetobacter portensis]MTD09845.1 MipA/OmpV family protein [Acinetobacter faecalis]UPO22239.1 MipA/OmpV family protein [Acinetobacter portensis]